MKTKLKSAKVNEMIIEDDDDEDAVLFQEQPYETVMTIGHSHMLDKHWTKLLARRSDILVSSTLSITLTPLESFVPTLLGELSPEERTAWIDLRSQFRAEDITSCKLPSMHEEEQELVESDEEYFTDGETQGQGGPDLIQNRASSEAPEDSEYMSTSKINLPSLG